MTARIPFLTTVAPHRRSSGGEVVSQAFIDGLREAGHDVLVVGTPGRTTRARPRARCSPGRGTSRPIPLRSRAWRPGWPARSRTGCRATGIAAWRRPQVRDIATASIAVSVAVIGVSAADNLMGYAVVLGFAVALCGGRGRSRVWDLAALHRSSGVTHLDDVGRGDGLPRNREDP